MDPNKKYVIVELNDGFKVEGVLTDVDKTNFTIHISEATKYKTDDKGNNAHEKLTSTELNISKGDIKEVKLVQYDQLSNKKQQLEQTNFSQMKTQNQTSFNNPLPSQNLRNKDEKASYNKTNFFDDLGTLSNRETVRETIKDNEKNKDTFNLPDREYSNNYQGNRNTGSRGNYGGGYNNNRGGRGNYGGGYNNNRGGRGSYGGGYNNDNRGGNRGRGGYNNYNRGGYVNNNNDFNNNNYNNNNYNNNNSNYDGQRVNNNSSENNYRGGFNNYRGGRGNNRGGRGNRNFNNNNNFNNNSENFNTFENETDDKCEERGKSIYDV